MQFIKLNGLLEKESNFFSVEIKNGKNKAFIGEELWTSHCGTKLIIYLKSSYFALNKAMRAFDNQSQVKFNVALNKMGINFNELKK